MPGAGKTLVGLDIAAGNLKPDGTSGAVYLSGNGPLVEVLRKALTDDALERVKKGKGKHTKEEIKAGVATFIQAAYAFRRYSINHSDVPPNENVIIFDEAQRCWDKAKLSDWSKKKMNVQIDVSEPHYFLSVMDRRKDWSAIVCLVGLGQDINDGEVGIGEWFSSAIDYFPDWDIYYSSGIFGQQEDARIDKKSVLSSQKCHQIDGLHLSVSVRTFRSEQQSAFVDAVLAQDCGKARQIYTQIKDKFPIFITRDIRAAKRYIRGQVRGSQRSGIVISSSAQRLKAEGVYSSIDMNPSQWFLSPKDDLRSSDFMDVAATEFKVQGLELDYAIVGWDADLRINPKNGKWDPYSFSGSSWKHRNSEARQRYLVNAYRVLLTRARQGMVIFVPLGDLDGFDKTRNPEFYDGIYKYLHGECGIEDLPETLPK